MTKRDYGDYVQDILDSGEIILLKKSIQKILKNIDLQGKFKF